jgi:Zn-dependent oligopeptidase
VCTSQVDYEFNRRCVDTNVTRLQDIIQMRAEMAAILGYAACCPALLPRKSLVPLCRYENHAAYVLETRMAKSPGKVLQFLTDLRDKLAPLGGKEIASLRKLKAEDYAAKGLPPESAQFSSWDFRHYTNREMEAEYNVGAGGCHLQLRVVC